MNSNEKRLRQSQKIKEELQSQLGEWAAEMDNPTAQADDFYIQALEAITNDRLTVEELIV